MKVCSSSISPITKIRATSGPSVQCLILRLLYQTALIIMKKNHYVTFFPPPGPGDPSKAQWTAMDSGLNSSIRSLVVYNRFMPVAPSRVTLRSGMAPPGLRLAMAGHAATDSVNSLSKFTVVYSMQVVLFSASGTGALVKYIAKLNTGTNKWNKSVRRSTILYVDSTVTARTCKRRRLRLLRRRYLVSPS